MTLSLSNDNMDASITAVSNDTQINDKLKISTSPTLTTKEPSSLIFDDSIPIEISMNKCISPSLTVSNTDIDASMLVLPANPLNLHFKLCSCEIM